jgi:hypothetical protein
MTLKSDIELANTQKKLAWLESRYQTRSNETSENEELRGMTLHSLKGLINQLKEEVVRYECNGTSLSGAHDRDANRNLSDDVALANTKRKLSLLEKSYEVARCRPIEDEDLHEGELQSLKRFINQLKEEIARYECRQPVQG